MCKIAQFRLNITYQKVKNTTQETITDSGTGAIYSQKDFDPGSIPDILINAGINYNITENITANMNTHYIGKRKRSEEKEFSSGNIVYVDDRDDIDDVFLINTTITLGNFSFARGLEFKASRYNILDHEHIDSDPSGTLRNVAEIT